MKTQILVTVEFDSDAMISHRLPPCAKPDSQIILGELNAQLRQWAATNPFDLRDKEHLRLALALPALPAISANGYAPKLAGDLRRMAGDLTALANITENL